MGLTFDCVAASVADCKMVKKRLEGKTALITGVAQGIGRATALKFVEEGCTVIATDLNAVKLNEFSGVAGVTTRRLDVTNDEEIKSLAHEFKNVDVLFNCAGYVHQGSILDCPESEWDRSFDLNVKAVYKMCKAFIPNMLELGRPCSIVNMSSVCSSVKGLKNRLAYGASKAAVIGMSRSLAVDFVERGIRVNSVCPGTVDTPSFRDRVQAFSDPEAALRDFISRQKMGRIGTAEEIAALVLYLASDESNFVTGTEIVVDGGIST